LNINHFTASEKAFQFLVQLIYNMPKKNLKKIYVYFYLKSRERMKMIESRVKKEEKSNQIYTQKNVLTIFR
ncbi:MAG: hypothetical protein Q8835_03135, partial [Sweet potato little leaf phytoplasma]|nr:hypothetical protein [Sweet potato little leaf phytoplasma]